MGWSLPIMVEGPPGAAKITGINGAPLDAMMTAGVIPVVAGYQGLNADGRLATLGRGGTDLSAAAVAAAVGAECDIYTDVDGVFTTDPRIAPEAAGSSASAMTPCWSWPPWARRCCRPGRWSTPRPRA
jgi:aspartate kinase